VMWHGCLIALFVMTSVFYVAGNELVLSSAGRHFL
jgi:hypothetical protein